MFAFPVKAQTLDTRPCYIWRWRWRWRWRRRRKSLSFQTSPNPTDRLHTSQRTNIQGSSIQHISLTASKESVCDKSVPVTCHITSDPSRDLDLDGIPVTPSRERLRHASRQKATTVTPFDFNTDCHRSSSPPHYHYTINMANPLDTDAGSELFSSYEAELKLVQADLGQKLDQIPDLAGEPRKAAISQAERALEEAIELVSFKITMDYRTPN
jgi:hypothetical protein